MSIVREPNTEYILSLSYGKDSLACLEAIRLLGYPLDRIIHAEVWATDTIPAELPPMINFKAKADKIILDRYGIVVEHTYARRSRERERESYESYFYSTTKRGKHAGEIYGFPLTIGAWCNNRLKVRVLSALARENDIRESVLPHSQEACGGATITGFPVHGYPMCNSRLKTNALRISNLNRQRELVHRTQNEGFQIAPMYEGRR